MKQGIEIFNNYDIEAIKKWIKLNEYDKIIRCPFSFLSDFKIDLDDVYYFGLPSKKSCPAKCNYIFPELINNENIYVSCPCHIHNIDYVIYKALRFIAEYESLKSDI